MDGLSPGMGWITCFEYQPSTVNRQLSTVNRQLSTINRQPSTIKYYQMCKLRGTFLLTTDNLTQNHDWRTATTSQVN